MQKIKNKDFIKIANLSSDFKVSATTQDKNRLNKIIKNRQFYSICELYIFVNMNIKDALYKNFKSLLDLRNIFKSNEDCIRFLESILWEGEPVSPYDINSKVYKCRDGWYKCQNTGKEFNILTGTLFQGTKIPLPVWFEIIFREHSDKGGLAATTVMRDYGLTYRTAWHMLHKIRNAMGFENYKKLDGVVETDEYYSGGSLKNMHYNKKLEVKELPNQNKKLLQCFVSRSSGDMTMRAIPDATESTINAGIMKYVDNKNSKLYTDDNPSYQKIPIKYDRSSVVHSKGTYVDKENPEQHTNTAESCWALHKRTETTHLKISKKHVQNYANETVFRYNTRVLDISADACTWFLQNIFGTRITWRQIRDAKYTRYNRDKKRAA
ncbi:IS1595 family transposase [bacterium]|nr:IS1595 family transposase [bacterium]